LVAQRKVSYEVVKEFCDKRSLYYVEVSAQTGQNVHLAFAMLVYQIHRRLNKETIVNIALPVKEEKSSCIIC